MRPGIRTQNLPTDLGIEPSSSDRQFQSVRTVSQSPEPLRQAQYGMLMLLHFPPAIGQHVWPCGETDDHMPAHRALSQVATARTGPCFGPGWRRRPGRPRHSWIQQIGDGTPFNIRAEWSKTRRRGHSGLTQWTSAVYVI